MESHDSAMQRTMDALPHLDAELHPAFGILEPLVILFSMLVANNTGKRASQLLNEFSHSQNLSIGKCTAIMRECERRKSIVVRHGIGGIVHLHRGNIIATKLALPPECEYKKYARQ